MKSLLTATISTLLLVIVSLVTAGAVYWLVSYHYQEILREKDSSYWEHVGRRETNNYQCEAQCSRLLDSSNRYYDTLVKAYEDRLKLLLDTDIESIQMREQSHREVLSIFQNHAVFVSKQTQSSTLNCARYCQMLQKGLDNCTSRVTSLGSANKRLMDRANRQRKALVQMHRVLEDHQSDKELYYSYNYWVAGVICIVLVARGLSAVTNREVEASSRTTQPRIRHQELTTSTDIQQLTEKLAEAEREGRLNALKADKLQKKLEATKSDVSRLTADRDKQQEERSRLEECVDKMNEQLDKVRSERESEIKKRDNTIKFMETQLGEEKSKLVELEQVSAEKIHKLRAENLQLTIQESKLRKELTVSHTRAAELGGELNREKQNNERLRQHKQVQDRELQITNKRISKLNKQLLGRRNELEWNNIEIREIQGEVTKHKQIVKAKNQEIDKLRHLQRQLTEDHADMKAAILLQKHELEMETDRKNRALKGLACQEEMVKRLKLQLEERGQRSSKTSHKKERAPANDEQVRLQVYRDFQIEYDRLEARTFGNLASLADEVAKLNTENRLIQIELQKAKKHNAALQELLERDHAQIRREEAQERMCRVTLDVYHASLTPPCHSC